ncbi:MAG: HAMP domain-containing histidine kinase [Clostridia bacterium]|jgi:signal transduction histidine kinase|nr:HAMP domain-containing histidine kinase [Clostridia bacterium]
MKSSIARKLTVTNVLIVIVALLVFFSIVIVIFNNYTFNEFSRQLLIENQIANRVHRNDKIDKPAVYKVLSDSVNLVYTKQGEQGALELDYSSDNRLSNVVDIEELIGEYVRAGKKVLQVTIDGKTYLCTITTNREELQKADSAIVSLISTQSVGMVTRSFIIALIITIAGLTLVSILITLLVSRRITKPITKLTQIAKQYEQRNFDAEYIADTNDEIQDLSVAVSHMARSIKAHEGEKDRLFRQISHEIKTPLTAIYGYAEGIKSNVFSETDKPLDIIMSESLRIKKLTENIVLLSKLNSNIEVFQFEQCDLPKIIERAIETIESIAILNDIDIDYQPKAPSAIRADEDKLFRAFVNILSNCTKYTKTLIKIAIDETNDAVEVNISDDGDGFDQEALDNLLSGTAQEKSNGSGIGLSIVNAIIEAHGGKFIVGNNEHGGALFTIVLKK